MTAPPLVGSVRLASTKKKVYRRPSLTVRDFWPVFSNSSLEQARVLATCSGFGPQTPLKPSDRAKPVPELDSAPSKIGAYHFVRLWDPLLLTQRPPGGVLSRVCACACLGSHAIVDLVSSVGTNTFFWPIQTRFNTSLSSTPTAHRPCPFPWHLAPGPHAALIPYHTLG